jgi:hypothetical protein
MRPGIVLAVILLISSPAMFGMFCPGSAAQGRSPEEGTITLSDFSAMPMTNLSLRPDGGVTLKRTDDYVSLPEVTVTSAPDRQQMPLIAMASNGSSLVIWGDIREGYGTCGVYGQMLDPDLNKMGDELFIYSSCHGNMDVTVDSQDNYLVVWELQSSPGGNEYIYGQRLDSKGAFLGDTINLSSETNWARSPRVVAGGDSYFVIWEGGTGAWTGTFDIYGQLLDLDGNKQGPNFVVAGGDKQQDLTDIASDGDDRYVVGWVESNLDNNMLVAKVIDSNGSEKTGRIIVDSQHYYKSQPAMEVMNNGSWAIAWSQFDPVSDRDALFARAFDATGNPIWNPLTVGTKVDGHVRPGLKWTPDDEFVAYWADFRGSPSDQGSLWARRVSSTGNLLGQEMAVSVKPSTEHGTSLAASADGALYFTWSDETTTDVHARKFVRSYPPRGTLVTGNISAPADFGRWSNLVASIVLQNASANTVMIEYSIDSGTTWFTVPDDGSIAGAASDSPLRIRVLLQTTDNRSTPILYKITLDYLIGSGPPVNHRPLVSTGPDIEAFKNTTVSLSATGSDEDGDSLTFSWAQLEGEPVQLAGQGTSAVTFVPARSGVCRFRVAASDRRLESLPAFVNVTVRNRAPDITAPADFAVRKNDRVFLNASGSDPDGDRLVFSWTQVSGDHHYFGNRAGSEISFKAVRSGTYRFRVVANDGEADSPAAMVEVIIPAGGETVTVEEFPFWLLLLVSAIALAAIALMVRNRILAKRY